MENQSEKQAPREMEIVETPQMTLMESQTRAEIDIQIATAKKYPRSLATFRRQVLEMATLDQETAESCWYVLPRQDRDGKPIQGPSVRFAEIVLSCYGNLRAASRPSSIDDDSVTSQAVCMDLEKNVGVQIETKRRIKDKFGKRYSDDMILMTTNAASSIALRNAIFRIVPKAIYKKILDEVKVIGMGEGRTIEAIRESIVEHFKKLGVSVEQISGLLEGMTQAPHKGVQDITLEDATVLRGIATAIKDGDASVEETFGPRQTVTRTAIKAENIKPGKVEEHTHPSVPPVKKAAGKPSAQKIADCRNTIRELTKRITEEELGVDLAGIMFGSGIDSVDRCEDVPVMEKTIKAIQDAITEATI
jgi:hypothetical protein